MLLSICMPTKGRGPQALRCIEQLFKTTVGFDVECVVVAHPDDSNLGVFLTPIPNVIVIWQECSAIQGWNIAATHAQGDYLKVGDDDLWYHDGWLEETMKVVEATSEGHGYFKIRSDSSNYWAERAIGSRRFFVETLGGVLCIPKYLSQYDDVEKTDRAIAAGLFFEAPKAYIEHRHWVYGKAEKDETYMRGGIALVNKDQVTYQQRKAAGFPTDYTGVIR